MKLSTQRNKSFKSRLALPSWLGVAALMSVGPTLGHPSYAMFDMNRNVRVTGVVERFDYAIPHSWLHVMIEDEGGEAQTISLEMPGVPDLYRQGIKSGSLFPGLSVTLVINPMRGDRPGGLWRGHVDGKGAIYGELLDLLPRAEQE